MNEWIWDFSAVYFTPFLRVKSMSGGVCFNKIMHRYNCCTFWPRSNEDPGFVIYWFVVISDAAERERVSCWLLLLLLPRYTSTWASSWDVDCWCVRTSSYGSWWHEDGDVHNTCDRSSCRNCTFGPTDAMKAQWCHHGDATPSEG